jgi:uncharacterized repeat protein (TIGR01451 family)
MWKAIRKRTGTKAVVITAAAIVGVQLVAIAPALANAANPDPDTTGTATVNADGTVTANLSGTWSWPGQSCEGRYGTGYAVDWWGVSTSQTPTNSFSLTNATEVTGPGVTTTGTISPAGDIPISGGTFFHVAQFYAGETVNSSTTCTDTGSGPTAGSTGSWTASATYPSMADIPSQVCVNMYDEHGSEGKPSGNANDFSPSKDNDNSIQTNNFNPTAGAGYCVALQVQTPSIAVVKQICKVAVAKCDPSNDADWVPAHEVTSGGTAVWRITVTNNGNENLEEVTVTDPKASACAEEIAENLAAGDSVMETCQSQNVTKGFTNVATATGEPPSGPNVSATGSAKVTVIKGHAGITVVKQICKVAMAKCNPSDDSVWVSSHEIKSGGTAVWRITVTNSGGVALSNVTVSDQLDSACSGQAAATLAPGASAVETCTSMNVTKAFTNVATATGTPPSGPNVTATGSATVTVIKPSSGITTSQSLTPNDEGFVNNGEGATGKMTFKLFPPSDPTCSGTPAFSQTITVSDGVAETTNTSFIATQPGKWRWLVTYSGDSTHKKATSPCGTENFVLTN